MNAVIRPLPEPDIPEADRIFRLAFGTFLHVPDPMAFTGDADLVQTRWRTDPSGVLGAYIDDALVGHVIAINWGSFGFFGPLVVRPDLWDKGIAVKLLTATMQQFDRWNTRLAALFTFPNSPKHIGLYQKFGFWPQHLTAVMTKSIEADKNPDPSSSYEQVPLHDREKCLSDCRALTDALYPGLDVSREIRSVAQQQIGQTVLIYDGKDLAGFAICHIGSGSEAGAGNVFVKFGAVRPGAARAFERLLSACESLASRRGIPNLVAGVNTARHQAYRIMLQRGFHTFILGVTMMRPNDPGYSCPDCYVIDDLR